MNTTKSISPAYDQIFIYICPLIPPSQLRKKANLAIYYHKTVHILLTKFDKSTIFFFTALTKKNIFTFDMHHMLYLFIYFLLSTS